MLFAFITCLGLASFAANHLCRRVAVVREHQTASVIAWFILAAAVLHLIFVPLAGTALEGGGIASLLTLRSEFMRAVVVWLLILLPLLAMGLVFPLLLLSATRLARAPGRIVGTLYFANTAGAVTGAAAAAFVMSRWLGTVNGFLILAVLMAVVAAAVIAIRNGIWARIAAISILLSCVLVAMALSGNFVLLRRGETLVASREDEYGLQVLARTKSGYLRVRNNLVSLIFDLGHPQTSHAQQMAAHLTMLLAENAEEVLNIGTGYGNTAGTFTLFPSVRAIETVEILPFVISLQERFQAYNFGYWKDPRVTRIQGDGRHHLAASPKRYDIISVNVLDPYLPGSSALYTVDFWRLARARLRPGGVYTQLFWGKDIPLLIKGLKSVFDTVLYFPAYGGTSYNVVAFKDAPPGRGAVLHLQRFAEPATRAVTSISGKAPSNLFPNLIAQVLAKRAEMDGLAAKAGSLLHSDDRPILEYRWAHRLRPISALKSLRVQW